MRDLHLNLTFFCAISIFIIKKMKFITSTDDARLNVVYKTLKTFSNKEKKILGEEQIALKLKQNLQISMRHTK